MNWLRLDTDQFQLSWRLIHFYRSYCPLLIFSFLDFSLQSFDILTWNLVYELVLCIIQIQFYFWAPFICFCSRYASLKFAGVGRGLVILSECLLTMLFVYWFLWPLRLVWLLVSYLYKEVYLQIYKWVSFWLHGCCGEWEGHSIDRPQSAPQPFSKTFR